MSKKQSFFLCEICGNLIGVIEDKSIPLVCCGEPMKELVANSTDAAQEKHVPVVEISGDKCKVKIGSVAHPMTEEHLISWVYVKTERGGQRKNLTAGEAPELTFGIVDDKLEAAYAYCNLHGLWVTEL